MFKRLTVRAQLLGLSAFFLLAIAAITVASLLNMHAQVGAMSAVHADRVIPLQQLKRVSDMYAVNIVDTAHKFRDGAFDAAQAQELIATARSVIREQWSAYAATRLTTDEAALVARLLPMMVAADQAVEQIAALIMAADKDAIRDFAAEQMYPAFDPMQGVIGELLELQVRVSGETVAGVNADVAGYSRLVTAFIVLVLALGTTLAWTITSRITRSLGGEPDAVREQVAAVARGELDREFNLDKVHAQSVMANLAVMSETLARVVADVRAGSESVSTAAREIAAGNDDLSQRTQEQASSLEETAASMEEMTSTVHANAENASQASQLSAKARVEAERGGEVASKAVEAMAAISQSSREIANIIGVIDEIAFQTNLLALNAAVEAARAGEQGRGFAVVAGEVRILAQRSASAAKEIKMLIATSTDKVSQGTELVDESGRTLASLVVSVKRVNDIVGEIAAANREQAGGIEQVNKSVMTMDEVTQQNAALVEEAAAASRTLQDQAETLTAKVAYFRLR
jgi:methyl-accepting chemotaxis protein/methyl-accepting chemotaxis protein-1 (serine sensor receptor)